jgi:hypothetical protein
MTVPSALFVGADHEMLKLPILGTGGGVVVGGAGGLIGTALFTVHPV